MVSANQDPDGVRAALFDPQFLPGFNDSGAHLTNMAFYDANLRGLHLAQRDGLDRVASHVRRLTKDPADFFRLEVGTLDVGARADVAVIDPDALAAWDTESTTELVHRDAFDHVQVVNRPPDVVTHTVVGGRLVWADGTPRRPWASSGPGRCSPPPELGSGGRSTPACSVKRLALPRRAVHETRTGAGIVHVGQGPSACSARNTRQGRFREAWVDGTSRCDAKPAHPGAVVPVLSRRPWSAAGAAHPARRAGPPGRRSARTPPAGERRGRAGARPSRRSGPGSSSP